MGSTGARAAADTSGRMSKREALNLLGERVSVPTLPEVVVKINSMIDDPSVGLSEMGALAGNDAAIAARVLRLANSGYYGLSEPVSSPEAAVTVIGARALRNVAMQVSILKRYEHLASVPDFDLEELWTHSRTTALVCQWLAERCRDRAGLNPDDFHACGLLHDVGKVVMLESLGDVYVEALRHARRTGTSLHEAEQHVLGFTHIDVGTLLASRWQLPDKVAAAIEFHHGPREKILEHPHVALVAIADQIAYRMDSATGDSVLPRLAAVCERVLGISRAHFDAVLERARTIEHEVFV
jgi:HD-like signal output (HDOD) protein